MLAGQAAHGRDGVGAGTRPHASMLTVSTAVFMLRTSLCSSFVDRRFARMLASLLLGCVTLSRAGADQSGTSERWNWMVARGEVQPLEAAPAAAQALLAWLHGAGGQQMLALLIAEGRAERDHHGRSTRREVGMSGYVDDSGAVVMLQALVCSDWYEPAESAYLDVGKARKGVPWAVHTHSWGNSISGILRGITDDFSFATSVGGEPGVLICLPLREADGTESLAGGRLQLIAPADGDIGCFEGRWIRTGDVIAIAGADSEPAHAAGPRKVKSKWLSLGRAKVTNARDPS